MAEQEHEEHAGGSPHALTGAITVTQLDQCSDRQDSQTINFEEPHPASEVHSTQYIHGCLFLFSGNNSFSMINRPILSGAFLFMLPIYN